MRRRAQAGGAAERQATRSEAQPSDLSPARRSSTPRQHIRARVAALLLAASSIAAAQEPPAPLPDQARGLVEPPGITGADVVLFVPRVILAVPRYAFEIVFFPIRAGLKAADDHAIIEHVVDFLYNDARTAAILPSASFLTGFGGSIGFTAFHDDVFGHRESVSLSAKFGGVYEQAYQLSFGIPHLAGSGVWLESRVRVDIARGLLFQGVGDPEIDELPSMPTDPRAVAVETRYTDKRFMALLGGGYTFVLDGWPVKVGLTGIYNHRVFGEEGRAGSGDRSIETVYDRAQLTGFDKGVDVLELKGSVILDWRDGAGFPSRGVYAELFAGYVPRIDVFSYGHIGFDLSGYVDLFAGSRVLIARVAAEGVSGEDEDIPFSELPRLGGPRFLRGYLLDRFRDRVAGLASLELRYPVHHNVMGHLFVDAGKVGRDTGELFDDRAIRFGYGFGIVVGNKSSTLFALDLAYGDGFVVSLSGDPLRAFAGRDSRL